MKTIKEFEQKDVISGPLMLTAVTSGISNNGAPYLSLTLQDKSGTIEGKLWDVKPEQEKIALVGTILEMEADVLQYKGQLQLRIKKLDKRNQRDYDLSEFLVTSDYSKDQLKENIKKYIDMIDLPAVKNIVVELFNRKGDDFFVYPAAAKNHHDFIGGLATHTLEMCQIGEALCDLYPNLNRSLLIGGILIHDFGKIDEYVSPIVVEYSTEGKLLGHISMLAAEIYEIAKEQGTEKNEEVMLLRHMVLSHHGKMEFGSPVLPQTLEAELLSLIDDMGARIQMFMKHLDNIEPGQFTSRIFPLENRFIYKSKLEKEDSTS